MHHSVSFGKGPGVEYLVLGAGPAGLQMGRHLASAGRSYQILEAGDSPGAFFKKFPRHRRLISNNKVHTGFDDPEVNLRFDWNSLLDDGDGRLRFKDYSRRYYPPADDLVRYLSDYAEYHGLNVRCNTRVIRVEKPRPDHFQLTDAEGNVYRSRRLIVATGAGKPYVPGIPGIELGENYFDVSVDPEDFAGQRVLILGKGNSAFETAENLVPTAALIHLASPRPVPLASKSHFAGHLRAVNNDFLDTYHFMNRSAVLDCAVESIGRRDGQFAVALRYSRANGETEEFTYDRVIVCTGFRFDGSIFAADCRPELVIDDRFPAQTCEWESVNVPGLYFAGTLMQANDWKKATSGFTHGSRYNVRALHRMLEKKHYVADWPSQRIEPTPEGLLEATLARVNRSSALWQQWSFLHDVIVVEGAWDGAVYYEEMPLAYIQESEIGASSHYYTIALELGKTESDPLRVVRASEAAKADRGAFLHPVIRRWCGRRLVSELHLPEDVFGEWKKPEAHVAPLRYFFMGQLLESVDFEKAEVVRIDAPRRARRRMAV